MNPFLNMDGDILIFLQDHVRNSVLNPFFKLITHLGDAGVFWIMHSRTAALYGKLLASLRIVVSTASEIGAAGIRSTVRLFRRSMRGLLKKVCNPTTHRIATSRILNER